MRVVLANRAVGPQVREMGGASRSPAPRNHLLVWIVKPSGCRCTDALGGKTYRRVPTPLRSTSPFSDQDVPSLWSGAKARIVIVPYPPPLARTLARTSRGNTSSIFQPPRRLKRQNGGSKQERASVTSKRQDGKRKAAETDVLMIRLMIILMINIIIPIIINMFIV